MNLKTIIIAFSLASMTALAAYADKDPEEDHIEVTLADGSTFDGYIRNSNAGSVIKNLFSASAGITTEVFISREPKGEKTKYSAKDLKEYCFVETSEANPEGTKMVSAEIEGGNPFKRNATTRGIVREIHRTEAGQILRWYTFITTGGQNSRRELVPVIGVLFEGAPAAIGFQVNGGCDIYHLCRRVKRFSPEFKDVLEEYFKKSPDKKAHFNELCDNPSILLALYSDFLKSNPLPAK